MKKEQRQPPRRTFLKQSGILLATFNLFNAGATAQVTPSTLPGSLSNNPSLDGWIRIQANERILIFTGKCELGQGILTAIAQMAADELDVAYERIDIVSADTSLTPDEGMTAGSQSVEYGGIAVRYACAEARSLLLAAAAQKLNTTTDLLKVTNGVITNGQSQVTYWELSPQINLKRKATASAKPKPASEHRIMGQSIARRDLPAKLTGQAIYIQDLRLPEMVFGRVIRPPSYRAKLESLDESSVKNMPGVLAVVRDGNFLAVAAKREEQAIKAAKALRALATWSQSPDLPPSGAALFAHMKSQPSEDSVIKTVQSPNTPKNTKQFQAEYTRPFQAHASIGPSCAVAQYKAGQYTVWTHTQGVFPLRNDLAKVLRTPIENITCVHTQGPGCYGHNGMDDVACDAALLSRATQGRPVQIQWMREDEFAWEPYGSAMAIQMKAQIDDNNTIVAWHHETWSHPHSTRPMTDPSGSFLLAGWHLDNPVPIGKTKNSPQPAGAADRNAVPLYDFANQKILLHYLPKMPLRTSALRTLGAYANVFALESFIDELAIATNEDPIAFRLKHLKNPRARALIEWVADKAKWQPNKNPKLKNHGRGFAFAQYKNLACYCAIVADVEVFPQTGQVKVHEVICGVDAGLVINPDGLINQIEGGIIQSSSWTLKEQVRFDAQKITTHTWADYPILTFKEVPKIQVHLLHRSEEKSLGVGEGSQGPTVAAIANALAHATGKRFRNLPFSPEKIKMVLAT